MTSSPKKESTINESGKPIRDLCSFNNLRVINITLFRHKDKHKFIWEGRGSKSIIYYIISCEKK
jgi:hypothetical protein